MRPTVVWPLIVGVISAISMTIGFRLHQSLHDDGYAGQKPPAPYDAIYEALAHVQHKYYGNIDDSIFVHRALDNIFDELDPYSNYLGQNQTKKYDRFVAGSYEGVGIDFAGDQEIYVFDVIAGSPAEEAQVRIGEQLISVNGQELGVDISYDSIYKIRHYPGDTIQLGLRGTLDQGVRIIKLVVGHIDLPLLDGWMVRYGDRDYHIIRIQRIYEDLFRDFMTLLERKESQEVEGLIIDLRDNPGGVVEEAVKILNQFFKEKDKILLSTKTKQSILRDYKSTGRTFFDFGKVIVLINQQSASASEIIAGVLQDYDRALIIGQPSYGKGLIQQNFDLSNNGSINLSIGEYILPSGRSIYLPRRDTSYETLRLNRVITSGSGVTPDISLAPCGEQDIERQAKDYFIQHQLWQTDAKSWTNVWPVVADVDTCTMVSLASMRWYIRERSDVFQDLMPTFQDLDYDLQQAIELMADGTYDQVMRPQSSL